MDIYRFMNSKDVADHLREIGHEFDAIDAAYFIEICEDATLDEKIAAWQELINTMPDFGVGFPEALEKNGVDYAVQHASWHAFLREYIDVQRRMLDMFEENEGCVYFLRELRYAKWPDCYPARKDGDSLWIDADPKPHSSLESCVNYLRAEWEDGGDEFDRYKIDKCKIDDESYEYRQAELVLDGQFRPLSIWIRGLDDREWALCYPFKDYLMDIPVPFKCGDIVIDRTARNPHPFVFDHLKFWNSVELVEHGCDAPSDEEAAKLDEYLRRKDEREGWDSSDMVAVGYELGAHSRCCPLNDPCDLFIDEFGAASNYLNLEHYAEPLEGNLKMLQLASKAKRGEIDVELVANFARAIDLKTRLAGLRSDYENAYTRSVHHLFKEAKS